MFFMPGLDRAATRRCGLGRGGVLEHVVVARAAAVAGGAACCSPSGPSCTCEPVRRKRRSLPSCLSKPSLPRYDGAALSWRRDLALHFAARHADHRHAAVLAQVGLGADLGREGVDDEVADERVVHASAVVAAAEVLVAVVDLEVADLERRVLHDLVEQRVLDRRAVDQEVAVLDPRLLVVPRRGVGLTATRMPRASCAFR